jgi:hypothetical protein
VGVGREARIRIILLDGNGEQLNAPTNISLTLTITTLANLEAAKQKLATMSARQQQIRPEQRGSASKSLDNQRVTLSAGASVFQVTGHFPTGEPELELKFIAWQTGRIRVFAEAPKLFPGDAGIIVLRTAPAQMNRLPLSSRMDPPERRSGPVVLRLVSRRLQQPSGLQLVFQPPGIDPVPDRGELVSKFYVELHSAANDQYVPAPENIQVVLRVTSGRARFHPNTITIPRGEVLSGETELRSRTGGNVSLTAGAVQASTAMLPYEFPPGTLATKLRLNPTPSVAMANGLEAISLVVTAVRVEADGTDRVMKSDDEGMDERVVTFRILKGVGLRFEQGQNQITLAKGQSSGQIKLMSSLPVGGAQVVAESINGLNKPIAGDTKVSFYFPWWPLGCAVLGGLVYAVLRRRTAINIAWGMLGGFALYVLALFGAIGVGMLEFGGIPVLVAKLPTDNILGASLLGLLGGYVIIERFLSKGRDKKVI